MEGRQSCYRISVMTFMHVWGWEMALQSWSNNFLNYLHIFDSVNFFFFSSVM